MGVEISGLEVVEIFNEVKRYPTRLFDMIRVDIRERVDNYLTALMKAELTQFLSRDTYELTSTQANH